MVDAGMPRPDNNQTGHCTRRYERRGSSSPHMSSHNIFPETLAACDAVLHHEGTSVQHGDSFLYIPVPQSKQLAHILAHRPEIES